MTGSSDPNQHGSRVQVPVGQGVQVGCCNVQENKFIGQYVETHVLQARRESVIWPMRVGAVPAAAPDGPNGGCATQALNS
jgi:hypothetical protein